MNLCNNIFFPQKKLNITFISIFFLYGNNDKYGNILLKIKKKENYVKISNLSFSEKIEN